MKHLWNKVAILLLIVAMLLPMCALADGMMPQMPELLSSGVYWCLEDVSIDPQISNGSGYKVSMSDDNIVLDTEDLLMTESKLESGEIGTPALTISAVHGDSVLNQTYQWTGMPMYMENGKTYTVEVNGSDQSTSGMETWMGAYMNGEPAGRASAGGYADNDSNFSFTIVPEENTLTDGTLNISYVLRDADELARVRVLYVYRCEEGARPHPTPIPGFVGAEEEPASVPSFYQPAGENLWKVSGDGENYRSYGYMSGEGPAFYPADSNGNVVMDAPVCDPQQDFESFVQGFRTAADIPETMLYTPDEDGTYTFTDRDGETQSRVYGYLNGEGPAFYPVEEDGTVADDAVPVTEDSDYAEHVEGFGAADPGQQCEDYTLGENGIYSFTDKNGDTQYRIYGRLNGSEPAYYPCDENGTIDEGAQAVDPDDDYQELIKSFTPVQPQEVPSFYEGGENGVWQFTDENGGVQYRAYGSKDGGAPAFYAVDENGEPADHAVPAEAEADRNSMPRTEISVQKPEETIPYYEPINEEDGLYVLTGRDGKPIYRKYGVNEATGETGWWPADEYGVIDANAQPVDPARDFEEQIAGFEVKMPAETEIPDFYHFEREGLYSYQDENGEPVYRTYGSLNREAPMFYPCDEQGKVSSDAEPVNAENDYKQYMGSFLKTVPVEVPENYQPTENGIYLAEDENGEISYFAYGSFEDQQEAFYPCDENGKVIKGVEPVTAEAEIPAEEETVPDTTEEIVQAAAEKPEDSVDVTPFETTVEGTSGNDEVTDTTEDADNTATEVPAESPAEAIVEEPAEKEAAATETPDEIPTEKTEETSTEEPAEVKEPEKEEKSDTKSWLIALLSALGITGIGGGVYAGKKKKNKK